MNNHILYTILDMGQLWRGWEVSALLYVPIVLNEAAFALSIVATFDPLRHDDSIPNEIFLPYSLFLVPPHCVHDQTVRVPYAPV